MDEFKDEIEKIWRELSKIKKSLKWLTDFQQAWTLATATKPRKMVLIFILCLILVALLRQFGYSLSEIWNVVNKIL